MNKSKIIECINNPSLIDDDATKELRAIAQEFPASPILHWLYLKGLQNQKSYLFNSALNRAAIGSPNRAQLLKWVGQESAPEEKVKPKFDFKPPVEEKSNAVSIEIPKPVAEPIVEKVEQVIGGLKLELKVEHKEEEKVKPKQVISSPKKETALPPEILAILERSKKIREGYTSEKEDEIQPVKEESKIVVQVEESDAPVEEVIEIPEVKEEPILNEIQNETLTFEIDAEVHSETVLDAKEETEDVKEIIETQDEIQPETYFEVNLSDETVEDEKPEFVNSDFSTPFEIVLEEYESIDFSIGESEESVVEKQQLEPASKDDDFAAWLKSLNEPVVAVQKEIPVKDETLVSETEKVAEVSFEIETAAAEPKVEMPIPTAVRQNKERAHKIELIDKFLEDKPKIVPKKENFSVFNLAEEPEPEKNEFITETLAQVYVKQGHYYRAIEAYEILGLKYPEKNGLFADRIREIKRLK